MMNRVLSEGRGVAVPMPSADQQAELAAPVAEVVEADYAIAGAFVEVGDKGAYDGASEVADVEFFGDVWAGKLEDDGLAVLD